MHIDVIDRLEALDQLKSDWITVYESDPEAHIFLSWSWIRHWLQHIRVQWLVLAAKPNEDDSHYVAFFPLQLTTGVDKQFTLFNELRTAGGTFVGYSGFICHPHFEEAIPAFANCLRQHNWARLHLDNIAASEGRFQAFMAAFSQAEFTVQALQRTGDSPDIDHAIYVYTPLPPTFDEFLSNNLGYKTRRNARACLREVDERAEYRITLPTLDTIDRDIDALLRLWGAQWRDKLAARYGAHLPHSLLINNRRMLRACFDEGTLFLPVLWYGDEVIAVLAALVDQKNRSLVAFLIGRDTTITKPSPGFTLHLYAVRWAIQSGLTKYDFLTGNFSYKYNFGAVEHRIECYRVSTRSGQNLGDQLHPKSVTVGLQITEGLLKQGKLAEAAHVCKQVLAVAKQAAELTTQFEAALAIHRRGNLAEAEKHYRSILKVEPNYFPASHLLGVLLLQQGKFEAAERQIRHATTLDPSDATAHVNRGRALRSLGRLEEALASYERAIALKADHAGAFFYRAVVLGSLNRPEEALASYCRSVALQPSLADPTMVAVLGARRPADDRRAGPRH